MPRKPKTIKPRRLYIPVVPAGASWVESDSYHRRTWNEIVADAPSIADLTESGERLVTQFRADGNELFLAVFKMNPYMCSLGRVVMAAAHKSSNLHELVRS